MKRFLAVFTAMLMLMLCIPVTALTDYSAAQRTALLDLTGVTAATSSAREGWSYDPTGASGNPLLVLDSYGSADAHSAPILLPADSTIEVNGECYIDNAVLGEDHDVISGSYDGYLNVTGRGTLNLYADQYHGCGITVPTGGESARNEILTVENVTVNYYGMERTIYTAYYLKAALYGNEGLRLYNMTLNTHEGGYGVWMRGYTLVGEALTEENAATLEIAGCTINIESITGNNWSYAKGIYTTYGNIHVTESDINISAGSGSFNAYKTIIFDKGCNINVLSIPVSTADYAKILYCNRLVIKNGIERIHIGCNRYIAGDVVYTKEQYVSELGDELTVTIGSFENGNFAGGTDPDYNNWPAFEVVGSTVVEPTYYTVSFYDYDGTLLSAQQVEEGCAAVAPEAPVHTGRVFKGWNVDFDCVTSDLDVTAVYALLGDADCSGEVSFADVSLIYLFLISGNVQLSEQGQFNADFDQNGAVDFADISAIYLFAIGG